MSSTISSSSSRAPPQLVFDDGSRIMAEESASSSAVVTEGSPAQIRGSTSIEEYYEIDRIVEELLMLAADIHAKEEDKEEEIYDKEDSSNKASGKLLRVAIQFPDELLDDSPEVCWLLEDRLQEQEHQTMNVFVFCLGDTTVGSCCPDEVAALHLQADVLVHYGHACLSPTGTLPVIYSFGRLELTESTRNGLAEQIQDELSKSKNEDDENQKKILLLYHVGYHYAISDLQKHIQQSTDSQVIAGQLPKPALVGKQKVMLPSSKSCCGGAGDDSSTACCAKQQEQGKGEEGTASASSGCCDGSQGKAMTTSTSQVDDQPQKEREEVFIVGGLELPQDSIQCWDDLSEYIVLFIGDPESPTQKRQYVNIMLQLLSLSKQPNGYWTYAPSTTTQAKLISSTSTQIFNSQLKRRFFLTQKAKDAHVFGIVVSNLSQQNLINVVKSIEKRIQDAGKSSYNFAVGKINPAKLANFAEIECFVLVACREHSLLDNERGLYHVPVITPLELDIALSNLNWGEQPYNLDCLNIISSNEEQQDVEDVAKNKGGDDEDDDNGDDDEDAPYFSLVTGRYVQKSKTSDTTTELDLEQLPGQGKVMAYNSEAAKFLKQREYQGLESAIGQTEVKAAIPGQKGIASNYSGS